MKLQRCQPFTDTSSAGKAAIVKEGLLVGRRRTTQDVVAVREAPEPPDDVGVLLGVFQVLLRNSSTQCVWSGRCSECMKGM